MQKESLWGLLHRTFYVIQVQKPYRADEDGF